MLKPPFKLAPSMSTASAPSGGGAGYAPLACCEDASEPAYRVAPNLRTRLADLDPHLHCSVVGTCLSTSELRKLMARFVFVRDSSDLEIHHEAVAHASQGGPIAKALHKLLDQCHETVVQRFAQAHDAATITALWDDALRQGEIPGAYWAMLTHREVTPALRQRVFGDVHMLSHLVGPANRADIRRLVALERENEELRDRAERQQLRAQELGGERDRTIARLQHELADAQAARALDAVDRAVPSGADNIATAMAVVALQTERRERAEQSAGVAADEAARLREELAHLGRHVQTLNRELFAAAGCLKHG